MTLLPAVSTSKARRHRNADTKRRLYAQCTQQIGPQTSEYQEDHVRILLATILQRLDGIEGLFQDAAQGAFWASCYGTWNTNGCEDDIYCNLGGYVPSLATCPSSLSPGAPSFVPARAAERLPMPTAMKSLPREAWDRIFSKFQTSQACTSNRHPPKLEPAVENGAPSFVPARAAERLPMPTALKSLPRDAWDRIYSKFQTSQACTNNKHPPTLEPAVENGAPSFVPARAAERLIMPAAMKSLPREAWDKIYSKFQTNKHPPKLEPAADNSAPNMPIRTEHVADRAALDQGTVSTPKKVLPPRLCSPSQVATLNLGAAAALVKSKETLHSRIDNMIELVEKFQMASACDPGALSTILAKVRDAQGWQKQSMSITQINEKITDKDNFMTDVVGRLRPQSNTQGQPSKEKVPETVPRKCSATSSMPQSGVKDDPRDVALDQMWHDQPRGRWWFQGKIICYYCGESSCEDVAGKCCEVRRREVLGIHDEGRRRKQRRKRK